MRHFFTNPLIVKEMRERFRSAKTFWILALYLFVMGAILFAFIYVGQIDRLTAPGENREVFILIAVIQFGMICFIAPALTAGTISGERERQTLAILLATQLSPAKIVLSKIVTSLAFIFLLVVASIPLYSIVFLYGGISPGQLFKLIAFDAVNILFFGSLGLFCSTWIKRTGVSTITAYGLAFFFVVGTGLLFLFLVMLLVELYPPLPGEEVYNRMGLPVLGSLNPVIIMFHILGESLTPQLELFMEPWVFFVVVYTSFSVLLIAWSGYLLKPIRRPWFSRFFRRVR